jgi:NADPH-dependent curcumin reductase CurA
MYVVCTLYDSLQIEFLVSGPLLYGTFVGKELKMQGFLYPTYAAENQSMLSDLKQWVNKVRKHLRHCRKDLIASRPLV